MSYQVLARKWRPKSFATLVGQEAAVTALSNALAQQRLHHAYLFTGTRGVGKTTLARILAKALNCETGITPEPCGQCTACRQIDAGRFVDLIELDAASNTGVDNIREVLDNAQYAPTSGRYKVYIIDEVHMLSKSAFNAMLKTLEEPPGHVKFILATTDPQKVPVTVLSRCLQFNLRPMTPGNVSDHLAHVLREENIRFDADALRLLGHAANGSMRDALSLLDQAIAYGGGSVSAEVVHAMLGSFDRGYLKALIEALLAQDGAALLQQAAQMESQGADWDNALQQLAELFQWVAVAQLAPSALPDDVQDRDLIEQTAQSLSPEDVQLNYQIALHGRRDLPLAPDPAAGFRMTLLRLLAFRPSSVEPSSNGSGAKPQPALKPLITKPASRPASSPALPTAGSAPRTQAPFVGKPVAPEPAAPEPAAPSLSTASEKPVAMTGDSVEPAPAMDELPAASFDPISEPTAPALDPSAALPLDLEASARHKVAESPLVIESDPSAPVEFDGDWAELVSQVRPTGIARMLANEAELRCCKQGRFELIVPSHKPHLRDKTYIDGVRDALTRYFGRPVQVVVEFGEISGQSVSAINQQIRAERQRGAEETMFGDPFVQALQQQFDATVLDIKPLNP